MSTTVTYKGQTLTTVENQTKTLNTAGTWVEGDFTLTDVSGGGSVDWGAVAQGDEPQGAIVLSMTKNFRQAAFRGCTEITSVEIASIPNNISASADVFYGCSALVSFDFGNLYAIGNSMFRDCTSLAKAESANIGRLNGTYSFTNTAITRACFPNLSGLTGRAFEGATHLELADIGNCDTVQWNLFNGCTALRKLIIRRSSVARLNGWDANVMGGIYNNPTESTIYVPSALISSYQTATNWSSAYSAGLTFTAIEGSPYENPTWYEGA